MSNPTKPTKEEYEYDGTGKYEGEDTCIYYDTEGDQHVEVKEDYSGGY